MIEVPTRFNRQRSHQRGSRSELIRRLETGTSARSWIIRGVVPIALPPMPLQNKAWLKDPEGTYISMVQEYIEIRGARENNLKDVSLRLPKRKITIFTVVSGSGEATVGFYSKGQERPRPLGASFFDVLWQLLPTISS